jgi:sugar lactone lactonase YvrE
MEIEEKDRPMGSLYCMHSHHQISKVLTGVTISNGIAFSLDKTTMYFIDSPLKRVDAFDFDCDSGRISNRRTVIKIEDGFPDGMTIDCEGICKHLSPFFRNLSSTTKECCGLHTGVVGK